jgi:N-acetylmuramoyl-L-alanine amidase
MARLDSIKRRVLREAVQENAGTRRARHPGQGRTSERLPWRRRRLASGIVFGLLLLGSAAWTAVARQHGLEPWPALLTLATARWSSPPTAMPTAQTEAPTTAPTSIDFQVFPLTVRKIAIDPGHGGEDGGAVTSLACSKRTSP